MIVEEFSIESKERLDQFECALKEELRHSSLRKPIEQTGSDTYAVSLRCDMSDAITLEKMINEWNIEDTPIKSSLSNPVKNLAHFLGFSKS